MMITNVMKKLARHAGVAVPPGNPVRPQEVGLLKLLEYHGVDTVIDVGANNGGYGSLLRGQGYAGAIVSFEPLEEAHARLSAVAAGSDNWHVMPRMALGAVDGEVVINVAENSTSSSVLAISKSHIKAVPTSRCVSKQRVTLRRLDGVRHQTIREGRSILLKIDTQGYEMPVLVGTGKLLDKISGIQIELPLVPLYDGQALYRDVIGWLSDKGFGLWHVRPGFIDRESGRLLHMDGIFFRHRK